jgi:hypothetical protein
MKDNEIRISNDLIASCNGTRIVLWHDYGDTVILTKDELGKLVEWIRGDVNE